MTRDDRIMGLEERINDLEESLQYANSEDEADDIKDELVSKSI